MAEVLGRIVAPPEDEPRGPDVVHGIRVRSDWLQQGRLVEFELPRNLTCAVCRGGGCDRCDRAGAVTLRDRTQPPELVQVTLPRCAKETEGEALQNVVLRIPECGGFPQAGSGLPRGVLLLKVSGSAEEDRSVHLAAVPTPPVPAPNEPQAVEPAVVAVRAGSGHPRVIGAACLFLLFWLALLFYLRSTGRG